MSGDRWYAKPNDLIGGWCIMPADVTPGDAPEGVFEIADCTSEAAARYIVHLHNEGLVRGVVPWCRECERKFGEGPPLTCPECGDVPMYRADR